MNDLRPEGATWDSAVYCLDRAGRPVEAAHDVTVWTERTDHRIAALEGQVRQLQAALRELVGGTAGGPHG